MHPETQNAIRAAWTQAREHGAPAGEPFRIDGDVYSDPARLELERSRIFARVWQPMVRSGDLEQTGAYHCVAVAGTPVVVLRGADGSLRARVNVCRHRGAQILRGESGQTNRLTCPYHGFTYDLEGKCTERPLPQSFAGQPAPDLLAVDLEEWGGWAWVRLAPEGPSLREFLGDELLDELHEWPFETMEIKERLVFEAEFDWKVGVEAFLESLHLPSIHRRTAHPLLDHRKLALAELNDHSRMSTAFRSPKAYGPDGPLGAAATQAGVEVFPTLNPVQRESNFSYLIFPATILNLLPTHFTLFQLRPTGLGRCEFVHELYGAPAADQAGRDYYESLEPGYASLLEEDLTNLPWIQRGVAAGAVRELALGAYEGRLLVFREALARWS